MKVLDTPLGFAAGRTLRELILIGHGVALVVTAIAVGDRTWNVYAYAGVTALFALRCFAGRVIYLSLCVAAMALQVSGLLLAHVTLADQAVTILSILGVSLLLVGGDLIRRFDDEGRGLGPVRNFWRELSVGQRRHLAWGMHLVATTGGLLHHTWYNLEASRIPVPAWLYAGVAAASGVGLLYLWGRAIAAPAAVALGAAVVWRLAPHVDAAWQILDRRYPGEPVPPEVMFSAHHAIIATACAAATALVALPWAFRWARLALR